MTDLEKQIEEAAIKLSSGRNYRDLQIGFINGAKSKEAKEYHTQNMYNEEEVLTIISKLGEFDSMSSSWLSAWFKKNKKK